ncbi:Rid family hydrolase [Bacteroides sp.]
MEYKTVLLKNISVEVQLSFFSTEQGTTECHAMIHTLNTALNAENQIRNLETAVDVISTTGIVGKNMSLVFRRYFMSDPANQCQLLKRYLPGAISVTGQAPLDYAKVALWCYFVKDAVVEEGDGVTVMKRSGYEHYYYTGLNSISDPDEYTQTLDIFNQLRASLKQENLSFAEELVRTWIYVQGVDTHYAGMVRARKEVFDEEGLTEQTHYIASTGIEGRFRLPQSLVYMDAYAIKGMFRGQLKYLHALEYLSPTSKYGVTFERGSLVNYGDRSHIFISGTASIDKYGEILFPCDVMAQAKRALMNILGLLNEGGADFDDLSQLIVYLRDPADYPVIKPFVESMLPNVPAVFLLAPVCRPGWLIEMECMAACPHTNDALKPF